MLTFTLILFLIACCGFIFSVVKLIINAIKKQEKKSNKNTKKLLIGSIILAFVALIIPAGSSNPNKTSKTTAASNKNSVEKNTKELTAGRYKASPASGSGNFFIYGSDGSVKTNEILGGEMGTPEVAINLEDGDIINISSLKNVKLVPEK